MSKVYIIGGMPRCGKSIIAKNLSTQLGIPVVEGDAIRRGLRNALFGMPEVFAKEISLNGNVSYHPIGVKERTEQLFEFNGHENKLTLAALLGVLNHYEVNEQDVIIEGPMITPEWVKSLKDSGQEVYAVFVGFLSDNHFKNIVLHAEEHKSDWINGLSAAQRERYREVWIERSIELKAETSESNLKFIDASKYRTFEEYLAVVLAELSSPL